MSSVRRVRSLAVCVGVCAAVAAGCSGDDDQASPSTQPSTTVAPTSSSTLALTTTTPSTTTQPAAPTTAAATTPESTSPASTAAATTTSAPACEPLDGTGSFNDGFPMRMSGLVGSDIRTGAHECFERVVIELAGSGDMPGVRVEYVDDPVPLSPSDETVEIDGDATLVISVAAWMPSMEGDGYDGPTQFVPSNVSHIVEVRQIENFEGMTAWALGLDREREFSAYFLESPARIVVDIASG